LSRARRVGFSGMPLLRSEAKAAMSKVRTFAGAALDLLPLLRH